MSKKPSLFTLILLISFGSVGATLFTPGLPLIAQYFHVSTAHAQLTITLFLVGYAVGQLFYGPLSNRLGRKHTLYLGIGVEIISAIICALAAPLHSFALLLIARLFMALGASVGLTLTFTIIADVYPQAKSTKIISYLILAFAITPGLGVSIGGFLVEWVNWQSCFYFLAAYGVILLILCYRLPETSASRDHTALHFRSLIRNYTLQLKNSQLLICGFIRGCGTSFVYIFAAMAPFIALKVIGLSPSQYGLFNLLPPLGVITGSLLAGRLAHTVSAYKAIIGGISIALLGVLAMLTAFLIHRINPATLFLPMIVVYIGNALIFANASSLATSQATDKSNASAMMNFINMGVSVLCVLLAGLISSYSALIMPLIYGGLVVILLGLYVKLKT